MLPFIAFDGTFEFFSCKDALLRETWGESNSKASQASTAPKASGPGAKSFGPRPGLSERVGDWIGGPRARSLRGAE